MNLFRNIFQKRKVEEDLDNELRFHLEMQIELNLQKGMVPEEARRQALLSLGGWQQTKERCRDVRSGAFLDILRLDLVYAVRSLLRSPGFLAVVLITLALGIGANTAIFSVVQAVLLRPLPFPDPHQLVMVWHREKDGTFSNTNFATYEDWKENVRSFESLAVRSSWEPTLIGYGQPVVLDGLSVSSDFFRTLGLGPYLGRDFLPHEDRPGMNRVVIISHSFWKTKLGGDPAIIGKQITVGLPRTVVGILPPQFESVIRHNFKEAEIFRPLGYDATLPYACRSCNHLTALARIREGTTLKEANREINAFTASLAKKYPQDYGIAGASLVPLQEQVVSGVRNILWLLITAVGVVLVIGCANIANLMLARGTQRSREMAIRTALGASRGRLMRQLILEGLLLAITGGGIGILFAYWGIDLLTGHAPAGIPRLQNVTMNGPVVLFAGSVTIISAMIFSLVPALQGSRLRPQAALQESSRTLIADRQKLRKALVVANIAMALMLLMGAGTLLQSIRNLLSQRLGFEKDHVLTMNISLTGMQYDNPELVDLYYQQVLSRVRALPDVESAGLVSQLPLSSNLDMYGIEVKDKPIANRGEAPSAERFAVSPGYLEAMRIPLIRGRSFTAADDRKSMPVVIINRTFAEKIWPGEDPVGKQIHIGEPERPWRTVVGVAGDVRHRGLNEPFAMQFYMPFPQWSDSSLTVVARSRKDPSFIAKDMQKAIWSVDANQPISQIASMKQVVDATVADKKFTLQIIQFFAIAAIFLAATGVYGVMAFSVTSRFQEIGLRMALGASRTTVLTLILRNGVVLAFAGIVIGSFGSLLFMNFLNGLLFQVSLFDVPILATVGAILFAVALAASAIPAIRAARVSPLTALREE